jgi:hypothetical protein
MAMQLGDSRMDLEWIWIAIALALYGVPFAIGFCVSSLRRAMLLAIASFGGLYASIWSALGPLFLPLAAQLFTRYEMSGIFVLSIVLGALQAALVAASGFALRRLSGWVISRFAHAHTAHRAA